MKRILTLVMALLILASAISFKVTASNDACSWYCIRTKDNLQPPLPSEFEFIKDYEVLWLNTSVKNTDVKRKAYLTFDAGYENGNVEKVLDILQEKKVPGAFFILINLIESNPELVMRMVEDGHLVCNHTANHKDMTRFTSKDEFYKETELLNSAFKNLTGCEMPKYFRPPEGKFNRDSLSYAGELGYKTVFWSFAYADWDNAKQPSYQYAKDKILQNMHNGAVILLHPTSATNAAVLGEVIDKMWEEGYEFGTLDELYKEISAIP